MSLFNVDPKITAFEAQVYDTPLIQDIWKDKYLQPDELYPHDAYSRVAIAIASSPVETNSQEASEAFYQMMDKRLFLPGGRILAGAGTGKNVTLMNCYVNETLDDSIEGIVRGKGVLWTTSSMGGGLGTDFSPLRPLKALIAKTGGASSGAASFINTFSSDGAVIRSANERRAAQMGTLSDTHPDLPEFIRAKGEGLKDGSKRWSELNVSVLVSDAFKAAVDDDEEWLLYFHIPPVGSRDPKLVGRDFRDDDGTTQYVYSVWKARDLWNLITEYTYEFSDPGVIFIDRVNDLNNLGYCETIRCTNPCGEQPLPPNGTCNLGAINVANCVRNPFTSNAEVDFELLASVAKWGVRFLDNVIDVTAYPLEAQRQEELNKRRIGLGITGLATMFAELRLPYGSLKSVQIARQVMKTIALSAYQASIDLAKERGSFPFFKDIIVDHGFIKEALDDDFKEQITGGLRNGVILTIAPVGTGSIALGNGSSGLEPDFALETTRRVRQNNTEEFKEYTEVGYTKRFYEFCTGTENADVPDYMLVASQLEVIDHIKVQSALQEWVDASTSKTINIPQDYPYDQFVEVYELAYQYGLKGTTTYRHSKWRDSILTAAGDSNANKNLPETVHTSSAPIKRPDVLAGHTYKLKWPSMSASMYVTINYLDDKPYEVFFASKDAKFADWISGLTLMISTILRSSIDPSIIVKELKQVVSTHDTKWESGKFYGSLVARLGAVIEQDFIDHGIIENVSQLKRVAGSGVGQTNTQIEKAAHLNKPIGSRCPKCHQPSVIHAEGCEKCMSCDYSICG